MKCKKKSKVFLVPYPAQGHVTPMLKLASLLVNHGINPIVIIPNFIKIDSKDVNISIMSISDGLDQDGLTTSSGRDFFAIEKSMENYMPCQLETIIRDQEDGIVCLIVDLLASWAIEIANKCGVHVAGFWPAMLATYKLINSIPEMLHDGIISETGCPLHNDSICHSFDQPTIRLQDLPWLIGNSNARISRFKFWTRTMERTKTLKWLLINTFQDECHNNKDQNTTNFDSKILPIGPLNTHVTIKNSSFWEEDLSCMNWLDKQVVNSVLYISFGSWVSPIGEAKVNSLALALEATKRPFIWVLGPLWRQGLQKGYLERISKQGKIVSWAPQMDVLQHEGVGCYLTHCGWNSTMEAIQSKKRLMCYPVAGDQFVNCAYIVQKWRIGVMIDGFGVKDLEGGLRKVMEDDGMSERIDRLNEMTMGKVASSKAMDNLTTFLSSVRM
ncbi:hypothetical protein MTR67_053237 [Solanum verrucosum]|uniref:Glycosyltransferase n=1 Tax=Solanum verrucosum TaxID=315347 RepID=A0AAF1A0N9_SOLVR|nr:UDP-glycosyltransferase 82A1 [Solanum verrucosum]XP_049399100.1 UDP-glycosyltransferase 82A1 [Solanum stenotomum]WMV59852.1 hypothetical protein MTR67_053237 [Solanum verrucosum]